MDPNFIHPTSVVPTATQPAVQSYAATPAAPAIPIAPAPAQSIGFRPTQDVQAAAPAAPTIAPAVLPVIEPSQSLAPIQPMTSPVATVAPKRSWKAKNSLKLAAAFTGFMLLTVGAAFLFNQAQKPITTDQSNARGVVVPEQDLGASVILDDLVNLTSEEEQTLIVNGDIRLQGALNFNSGEFLGQIVQGNLTTDQVYTLPNASGELCLSSNNCSFLTAAQLVATGLVTADQLAQAQSTLATAAQLAQLQSQLNGIVITPQTLTGGSGISVIGEVIQNTGVLTLNGQSGSVVLTGGGGILVSGSTISNSGVLEVQGQTGSVSFTAGSGIDVSGTVISNNGVLSLAGQTGALDLVSGPGISISGLTISNNGVTSTQGLTGNVVFTAGSGIDITGTAVSNTGVTLLTGTTNQVAVSGGTGSVTLSLPQDIAVTSSPSFAGLTLSGALTTASITSTAGLTVGSTTQSLTLQGSTTQLTATNGANTMTLTFQSPTSNVIYRFTNAAAGTYDICTTTGNCSGVGGGVTTPGGTAGTIPKFTSTQGIGDSLITDDGTTITINGDFDVTGVINGQLVSPDAHFTGDVTIDLDLDVGGMLTVGTISSVGAMTVGNSGQSLLLQGSAVTLSNTDSGITNSLVFATPAGSNKTITLPNASGTVCLTSGNCAGVGGTGDLLQGGNSFGTAMTVGTNDNHILNFETNGTTAMTILTSGNVGIGTTNPNDKLQINNGDIGLIGTGSNLFFRGPQAGNVGHAGFFDLNLLTNGVARLTIEDDGDVGIGVTNPAAKLQVNGSIRLGSAAASTDDDGDRSLSTGGNLTIHANDGTTSNGAFTDLILKAGSAASLASQIRFHTQNTERFTIASNGNIGVGESNPTIAKLQVGGGNILIDNTYSYRARNNAATAINLLGLDASNHLNLGATSGMGNANISAGTGSINFATSSVATAMTILNGGNVNINGSTTITPQLAASIGLVVKGVASQTGSLTEWTRSDSSVGSYIAADGRIVGQAGLYVNAANSTNAYLIRADSNNASAVPFIARGAASQSANLQEWQSSTGTVIASVDSVGRFYGREFYAGGTGGATVGFLRVGGTESWRWYSPDDPNLYLRDMVNGRMLLTAVPSATNPVIQVSGRQTITVQNTTSVGLTITAAPSATADLQQWQSSGGTVSRVDISGRYISASDLYAYENDVNNQVRVGATGAGAGLLLGSAGDTNLYRSSANVLKTDDTLSVATGVIVGSRDALKPSNWGYSTGYKVLIVGSAGTTCCTDTATISFGYDPIGNPNSSFSGDGRELLFRNRAEFLQPNAANTAFHKTLTLFDGNVGLGTNTNINSRLTLAADTTAAGGILFGTDTNLYRSAADVLKTDDSFYALNLVSRVGTANQVELGASVSFPMITFGSAADTNLYRSAANFLKTDDSLWVQGSDISGARATVMRLGAMSDSTTSPLFMIQVADATDELFMHSDRWSSQFTWTRSSLSGIKNSATLMHSSAASYFDLFSGDETANNRRIRLNAGGAAANPKLEFADTAGNVDVNLYRSAASTLKTDVTLHVGTFGLQIQPSGNLAFGNGSAYDVNLYRSGTDTLRTDDAFEVGGTLRLSATSTISHIQGAADQTILATRFTGEANNRLTVTNRGVLLWGDGTASPDVSLYRPSADTLKTDDQLFVGANSYAQHNTAYQVGIGRVGPGAESGISFGANDTNLYRSAANTLKTDDNMILQPTGGSTTALQILDGSSASLLVADTTNMIIKVATTGSASLSGAALLVTKAEITTAIRVGDGTNGVEFSAAGAPVYRGTARPTRRIAMSPEFSGMVLSATGGSNTGTMTAGYDSTNNHNYYNWTTAQVTNQNYDLVLRVPVPNDYSALTASPQLCIYGYTTDTTNGLITVAVKDSANAAVTLSSSSYTPGSTSTWAETCRNITGSPTITAGGWLTVTITMQAPQSGNTRVGELRLDYLGGF